MNLEGIMQSEISHTERQVLYDLTYSGIFKKTKLQTGGRPKGKKLPVIELLNSEGLKYRMLITINNTL